jgi:hypothetical protein
LNAKFRHTDAFVALFRDGPSTPGNLHLVASQDGTNDRQFQILHLGLITERTKILWETGTAKRKIGTSAYRIQKDFPSTGFIGEANLVGRSLFVKTKDQGNPLSLHNTCLSQHSIEPTDDRAKSEQPSRVKVAPRPP